MPKILFITTVARTLTSFLLPHAQLLRAKGWQVEALAQGAAADPQCQLAFDRVYEASLTRNPLNLGALSRASRFITQLVESRGYQLVHVHTPIAAAIARWGLRRLQRERKLRLLYTAHGFHFYRGAPLLNWLLYYPVERFLAPYTDYLLTMNSEDYERARTLPGPQVFKVPGVGIDVGRFQQAGDPYYLHRELNLPPQTSILLSIGELSKRKNHQLVLRALAKLTQRPWAYAICGSGPLAEKLKAQAQSLGLESRVHFLGQRKDIPALLQSTSLFLFPSLQEGLPVALMEAMAASRAAVCSAIRGNIDLLDHGYGGYLCPSPSPASWAQAINTLLEEPALRERMGHYNAHKVAAYDLRQVLPQMEAIYERAAQSL